MRERERERDRSIEEAQNMRCSTAFTNLTSYNLLLLSLVSLSLSFKRPIFGWPEKWQRRKFPEVYPAEDCLISISRGQLFLCYAVFVICGYEHQTTTVRQFFSLQDTFTPPPDLLLVELALRRKTEVAFFSRGGEGEEVASDSLNGKCNS